LSNFKYLIIPIICLIVSQIIKFIFEWIRDKEPNFYRLFDGCGGMPSTHSAFVTSLSTIIGIDCGCDSVLFAICVIFSLVVLYDAMGIRYEAGKQATILKDIVLKLDKDKKIVLREKIGHKPIEVLCGVVLGVVMTIILNNLFF